ncbi:tyrosine-type recombinase/integrase [Arthrobacter sp. H14-L1]|uniref:tyrosine-type recombinase/integrase n=1 Tax=Arthrobacter sp. H14-L1 TaxID=2996697 RepID=UPI00226F54F4|nr:tyrosine-type recombinase/integrase [Arthrobacter sp. H14-L1]MCY0906701.1 tyrosine-type recombinase/integrase [Arthrobacter sp. H14-L1]
MSTPRIDGALMADKYLQMRRSMGYKLDQQGQLLMEFITYFLRSGDAHLTSRQVLEWATLPAGANPVWWYARLGAVRPFAQYLQAFDPLTQVPDPSLLLDGSHRVLPYIFSDDELARVLQATDRLITEFRARTYRTYISLVAVTGMRRSEATHLDCSDIDWGQGILTIREAKFHKSRQLPLHPSTVAALAEYSMIRDAKYPHPKDPAVFLSARGTRLIPANASQVFARLAREADVTRPGFHHQPHLHDLRHTYAVKTLQGWYRAGADVGPLLPLLWTYLGHQNPAATYWYLSGTPELMTLVSDRLGSYLQEES